MKTESIPVAALTQAQAEEELARLAAEIEAHDNRYYQQDDCLRFCVHTILSWKKNRTALPSLIREVGSNLTEPERFESGAEDIDFGS